MARNSKVWLLRECSRMGLMGPGRVLSFSPAVFFSYWEGHSQRGTRIRPSKMQGSGQGPLLLFFWHFPHYCLSYAFFFLSVKILVAQSCPTLCDPIDCRPPGSSVHGILQAIILEWIAIPFSRGSSWPRDQTRVSCIEGRFFTDWATREAPLKFFKFILKKIFNSPLSKYF